MRINYLSIGLCASAVALALGLANAAAPAPGVTVKDAAGTSYTGDATAGERTFRQCATCHKLEAGKQAIGPSLFGVIGRKAGTLAGYTYSGPMKNSGLTWTEQTLFDFLENPRGKIAGTKMTFGGLKKPQDRANVIAFIKKATAHK